MTDNQKLPDIVERIRFYIGIRGGPAKDENGKFVGTAWPLMLEAADEIERLRIELLNVVGDLRE